MYLNEENGKKSVSKGWISTLGRSVLELRPSALAGGGTAARRGAGVEPEHACAFSCDGGHCTEGRYHVCVAEHLRGAQRAPRSRGTAARSTCSNTGPLMRFHTFDFHC